MRYLCDRNLGRYIIPNTLRQHGIDVIVFDEYFKNLQYDENGDDEWLSETQAQGWIVLTKDVRMRKNSAERQAIINYKIGCIAIGSGNYKGYAMAQMFLAAWSKIEVISLNEQRPFYYVIWKDGTLHPRNLYK